MKTIPLNLHLLLFIEAVQARYRLAILEEQLGFTRDRYADLKAYFSGVDKDRLASLGLCTSQYCLEAVMNFEVTPELRAATPEVLAQYDFSYPQGNQPD